MSKRSIDAQFPIFQINFQFLFPKVIRFNKRTTRKIRKSYKFRIIIHKTLKKIHQIKISIFRFSRQFSIDIFFFEKSWEKIDKHDQWRRVVRRNETRYWLNRTTFSDSTGWKIGFFGCFVEVEQSIWRGKRFSRIRKHPSSLCATSMTLRISFAW